MPASAPLNVKGSQAGQTPAEPTPAENGPNAAGSSKTKKGGILPQWCSAQSSAHLPLLAALAFHRSPLLLHKSPLLIPPSPSQSTLLPLPLPLPFHQPHFPLPSPLHTPLHLWSALK